MSPKYEILFNRARQKRGMAAYAVMQEQEPGFSIAVSCHHLREDAEAAKHQYEAADAAKAEGK
jgi:hypothetical protein